MTYKQQLILESNYGPILALAVGLANEYRLSQGYVTIGNYLNSEDYGSLY